jgi:superfamily II DNA/RNA helicase
MENEPQGTFQDLLLHPAVLRAVEKKGYKHPTQIQQEAIPKILAGHDLRASAQTGTGKTAAFILPALTRLAVPSRIKGTGPRILVLVPTRELAMQVAAEAAEYAQFLSRMKTVCIYGGAPYPIQNRELSRPYEILVATPGRLIDHLQQGRIDFSRLEMLILDEADRMLDMGFIEPVAFIADATPKERQTLLFSATLRGNVMNLSNRLLRDPVEISVADDHAKHENIEQRLHFVDSLGHKHRLLDHLLNDVTMNQAIVFTSTKMQADQLVDKLYEGGHSAAALHGDMNQRQRTRTITKLRQGEIRILVATDVAARGIDVQTISHVINFDLPMSAEDYVHRIGRTGRAGSSGIAVSFAAGRDLHLLGRIEKFTGQKITPHVVPGMEPSQTMKSSRPPSGRRPFPGRKSPPWKKRDR